MGENFLILRKYVHYTNLENLTKTDVSPERCIHKTCKKQWIVQKDPPTVCQGFASDWDWDEMVLLLSSNKPFKVKIRDLRNQAMSTLRTGSKCFPHHHIPSSCQSTWHRVKTKNLLSGYKGNISLEYFMCV